MNTSAIFFSLLVLATCASAQDLRMNCGGGPYADSGGSVWNPDQPYAPGGAGFVGGAPQPAMLPIAGGTDEDPLFFSSRAGMIAYRFTLPPSPYVVRLGFMEGVYHGPGFRRFSVTVEGQPVVVDRDLLEDYSRNYATWARVVVPVTDGVLDIDFGATLDVATISAIEVLAVLPDAVPPATPTGLAAAGGFAGTNVLDWADSVEDDLFGYVVERAPAAGGPYTPIVAAPLYDSRLIDDSAPAGSAFYTVRAVDLFGNVSPASPPALAATRSDTATSLGIIELFVDPIDIMFLDADPATDTYVPATATLFGEVLSEPVEVRYRGNVTRIVPKKAWKLRLPTTALHAGRRKLNIKSQFVEYSLLREEVAFGAFRARGIPTPDARQVQLRVNGEYRGVYLEIEQVDEAFLERHRLDAGGDIYKSLSGDFSAYPTAPEYALRWERETHEGAPYTELIDLCVTLDSASAADLPAAIAARFDVQSFLDYWAIQSFLGNIDFTVHNFYVYRSTNSGHFMILPWDVDHAFGNMLVFDEIIVTDTPIDIGSAASPIGPGGVPAGAVNRLYDRLMSVPLFRHMYVRKLEELMAGELSPATLDAALTAAQARLHPDALADVHKAGWEERRFYEAGVQLCRDFLAPRSAFVAAEIPAYAPMYVQELFLNEVLAQNEGTALDEVGEPEDYVEIYNAGAAVADLSGFYLTDDASQPTRWQVPAGTLVAPGGRILVWCDNEPTDGPLHATFSLAAAGEQLALFAADGVTLLDCLHWDRQWSDLALARLGDGGALFSIAAPTPELPNGTAAANRPPILWGHRRDPLVPAPGQSALVTVVADDDADAVNTVTLTYDAGAGAVVLLMADDGFSGDGSAGDGEWGGRILGVAAGSTVTYSIEAIDAGGRAALDPEGAPTVLHTYRVGAVVAAGPVLNELMADNQTTLADSFGDFDDWLEIHNPTAAAIDLGGMFVSDDTGDPTRHQLPVGLVVPAGGHLLLWADGEAIEGADHLPFRLSSGGEDAVLTAADGVTILDSIAYGAQGADESFGRLSDAAPGWVTQSVPTPGSPNGACIQGCGDCNDDGALSILDALTAAQHSLSVITLPPAAQDRCDTNGSGTVDILDALRLAQASLGLLCVDCTP